MKNIKSKKDEEVDEFLNPKTYEDAMALIEQMVANKKRLLIMYNAAASKYRRYKIAMAELEKLIFDDFKDVKNDLDYNAFQQCAVEYLNVE